MCIVIRFFLILFFRESDLIEDKSEEHYEMQKNNDIITDAVVRMRTDNEFFSIIEGLNKLSPVQLASVKQVVDAFLKD